MEAVEELSKLLFVHVMAIGKSGGGISRKSIRENFPGMSMAKALKTFVKEVLRGVFTFVDWTRVAGNRL